jgi:hypothetical protein
MSTLQKASRFQPSLITVTIIVLLLLGLSQPSKGQAAYIVLIFGDKIATENFHLTIEAGLNHSQMPGLEGSKGKFGIYYGMGIYMKINDKWAFTPEFKPFSYRGAENVKPISPYDIDDATYNLALNYLDVPFLFQYKISPKLFITTGPQVNLLLSAKQRGIGYVPGTDRDIKISESFYDKFEPVYFSWPAEIIFHIPDVIKTQDIELKGRYSVSFNNVIADKSYGSSHITMLQFILSIPFVKDGANK